MTRTIDRPVFLCDRCSTRCDRPLSVGRVGRDGLCSRCRCMTSVAYRGEISSLRKVGGPAFFTTSSALMRPVPFDVNGYYREMGVLPEARRSAIRDAVLAAGRSYRTTAIARVLLNRGRRRSYDAAPYGSVYVDELVRERLSRMPVRPLDTTPREYEDEPLGWGHYLLGSGREDFPSSWRAALICALRGFPPMRLALGWQGPFSSDPFSLIRNEDSGMILLIRETEPVSLLRVAEIVSELTTQR